MSFANSDSFTYSFPVWMAFVSFISLIALARTSNTMLNRNDENEHSCFVPEFKRKAFSFFQFSMIIARLVIHEVYFVYAKFVKSFYHIWMLNFIKCFSESIVMIILFISFIVYNFF